MNRMRSSDAMMWTTTMAAVMKILPTRTDSAV
jgi:hypothetical protein